MLHTSLSSLATASASASRQPPLILDDGPEDDEKGEEEEEEESPFQRLLKPKSLRTMTGPTTARTARTAAMTRVAVEGHGGARLEEDGEDFAALPLDLEWLPSRLLMSLLLLLLLLLVVVVSCVCGLPGRRLAMVAAALEKSESSQCYKKCMHRSFSSFVFHTADQLHHTKHYCQLLRG